MLVTFGSLQLHTMDLHNLSGKPINVWEAHSAVIKFFGSFWRGWSLSQKPALGFPGILQPIGKSFTAASGADRKVHSPFGVTTNQEPQMGNPKSTTIFGFQKFILSILSDIEKFTGFNSTVIFLILAKMGAILLQNCFCGMAISN